MNGDRDVSRSSRSHRPPHPVLVALELRAPFEAAATVLAAPLLATTPRGDGHTVVVLPPFGAADQFTFPLRLFLRNRNLTPQHWGNPEVLGLHRLVTVAVDRVKDAAEASGGKVSLVGHSLGGVYAREIARYAPELVRQVITLGSPFHADMKANWVWPMFENMTGTQVDALPDDFMAQLGHAPPVPTTSIFSRTDGVVSWRTCIDHSEGQVQNLEVVSSHVGLPTNAAAMYLVGERLSQPEDGWEPFRPIGWQRSVITEHVPGRPRR